VRVLLITDWMAKRGGVETYTSTLRDGLQAEGDEVRLLTSSAGARADAAPDYVAYGTERVGAQAFLQIANPFAVARVKGALRDFRPDVVQVHMFALHLSPAIFGPLRSVPTLLFVHDYKPVCPTSWKLLPNGERCTEPAGLVCWRGGCTSLPHWIRDRPRYGLMGLGLRAVDRVLAPSRSVQRELAVKAIESQVLQLPVPPPQPGYARRPASDPLFVFCGRLSEEKGVDLLLGALARLRRNVPSARLRLVGTGSERPALERLVRELELGERVSFRGWVPPERVGNELVDAWALVAPSRHAEPLGMVAIEALVRGVPVIASATGGFAETVRDGVSGLLFANGDEEALVRSLEAVARRQAFPDQRVPDQIVRRVLEAHSPKRHVRRLRQIYGEVINGGGGIRTHEGPNGP
jgi:glycosyltransferase involved in cell wall biosynthesis